MVTNLREWRRIPDREGLSASQVDSVELNQVAQAMLPQDLWKAGWVGGGGAPGLQSSRYFL